jgi:hypothetical protein
MPEETRLSQPTCVSCCWSWADHRARRELDDAPLPASPSCSPLRTSMRSWKPAYLQGVL